MHGESCDRYLVIDHNGDAYPCDFFVLPNMRMGNIMDCNLADLEQTNQRRSFAADKSSYGAKCLDCEWLSYCHGGCIKHRTVLGGKVSNPSYFCHAYRQLYEHSADKIRELAAQIAP